MMASVTAPRPVIGLTTSELRLPGRAEQIPHADPGGEVRHQRDRPTDPGLEHEVTIEPDSQLGRLLGTDRLVVNSFHHQAVRRLGEGLRAVAWAPDGLVEGVEDPRADFRIGVQWHAEAMTERRDQLALFRAFVEAAGRYAASASSTARTAEASQRS